MNIKKLILGISLLSIALLAFTLYSGSARADDNKNNDRPNHGQNNDNNNDNHNSGNFNPNKELSQSACGEKLGNPIINVTQKVQNDADSGQAGNYWAFDYYTRRIKVWSTGVASTYCAIVTYDGNFYAVPGQVGPGGTVALINTPTNAPVNGDMSGGYRDIIIGVLQITPLNGWPTNGNVGTTNYQCNISGACPGIISWRATYFSTISSDTEPWWGWKYNGGSHGTWINASTGNSGNIL